MRSEVVAAAARMAALLALVDRAAVALVLPGRRLRRQARRILAAEAEAATAVQVIVAAQAS
jgi:hypothetical protein